MDRDVAQWLVELILQATHELSRSPGLTIEVENDGNNWVQVIPEEHEEQPHRIAGYVVNFPQRFGDRALIDALQDAGVSLPSDTAVIAQEDNGYGTLLVRADIPLVVLALLVGDIVEKIGGAAPGSELNVQLEYGF
jgi:hypothetical protein